MNFKELEKNVKKVISEEEIKNPDDLMDVISHICNMYDLRTIKHQWTDEHVCAYFISDDFFNKFGIFIIFKIKENIIDVFADNHEKGRDKLAEIIASYRQKRVFTIGDNITIYT